MYARTLLEPVTIAQLLEVPCLIHTVVSFGLKMNQAQNKNSSGYCTGAGITIAVPEGGMRVKVRIGLELGDKTKTVIGFWPQLRFGMKVESWTIEPEVSGSILTVAFFLSSCKMSKYWCRNCKHIIAIPAPVQ